MSEGTHVRDYDNQEWFARGSEGARMLEARGPVEYVVPGAQTGENTYWIELWYTSFGDVRCSVCGWFRHLSASRDDEGVDHLHGGLSSGTYSQGEPGPRDPCDHCHQWQDRWGSRELVDDYLREYIFELQDQIIELQEIIAEDLMGDDSGA